MINTLDVYKGIRMKRTVETRSMNLTLDHPERPGRQGEARSWAYNKLVRLCTPRWSMPCLLHSLYTVTQVRGGKVLTVSLFVRHASLL